MVVAAVKLFLAVLLLVWRGKMQGFKHSSSFKIFYCVYSMDVVTLADFDYLISTFVLPQTAVCNRWSTFNHGGQTKRMDKLWSPCFTAWVSLSRLKASEGGLLTYSKDRACAAVLLPHQYQGKLTSFPLPDWNTAQENTTNACQHIYSTRRCLEIF